MEIGREVLQLLNIDDRTVLFFYQIQRLSLVLIFIITASRFCLLTLVHTFKLLVNFYEILDIRL